MLMKILKQRLNTFLVFLEDRIIYTHHCGPTKLVYFFCFHILTM